MSIITAAALGIIQGFAELFPFSSLGILVILPHVVPMTVPVSGSRYLPFIVALHTGTAIALIIYFRREWGRIIGGFFQWFAGKQTPAGRMAWLLIWGTIPAGLVGLLLKHKIAALFGNPTSAAAFLIVNGFLMVLGDRWHRKRNRRLSLKHMSGVQAIKIGLYQILALIPGLSRSGATITGGVSLGLSFEEAAHFSFLLATPIILAAALVELPKLHGGLHGLLVPAVVGGVLAGVTAWLSTRYLMRYFMVHNLGRFAVISVVLGAAALAIVR